MTQLILPPHVRQYKAEQMVQFAREQNFHADKDLLYTFAERGLVAKPVEHRWNALHLNLWLNLLQLKQYRHASIAFLYNIPVFGWLFFGEKGGVELDQMQLAMSNWVRRNRSSNLEAIRKSVQHTITTAKTYRHSTNVRETKRELQKMFAMHGEHDWERVHQLFSIYIFGDTPSQRNFLGPVDAPLHADALVTTWKLRERMFFHYEEMDLSEAWQWECARAIPASNIGPYSANQQEHIKNTTGHLREMYAQDTFKSFMENACIELLTLVALVRDTVEIQYYIPNLADNLQPLSWQQGRYEGRMTFQCVATPSKLHYEGNHTILPRQY